MNEILVSVIMPVYNAEKYLKESIESILQQTYSNIELIIIDDGSKDNSIEIIKNYKDERVRSFYFANSGCSKQRNYGLYKASGDIIALMDADDISEKTRLENQIDFLKSNQDIKILGTNCLVVDENGKKMHYKEYPEFHNEIEFVAPILSPICHPSIMTYKKILLEINGYAEDLVVAGDYDLILRLLRRGYKIHNYQKNLYRYRISNNSLSRTKIELQRKNHYRSSINYLNDSINTARNKIYYDYRRGLLEYYYGDIFAARKYLLNAFRNHSAPKIRLLRLLASSIFGNTVINYLRRKRILEYFNRLVLKTFKFDLQKVKTKNPLIGKR